MGLVSGVTSHFWDKISFYWMPPRQWWHECRPSGGGATHHHIMLELLKEFYRSATIGGRRIPEHFLTKNTPWIVKNPLPLFLTIAGGDNVVYLLIIRRFFRTMFGPSKGGGAWPSLHLEPICGGTSSLSNSLDASELFSP